MELLVQEVYVRDFSNVDSVMKLSRYNILDPKDDKILLFNSKSMAIVESNCEDIKKLDNMDFSEDEFLMLKENGFIVEDDVDELEDLKKSYLYTKHDKSVLSLTIKVTNNCNLRCVYCYQDHVCEYMGDKEIKILKKFFEKEIETGTKIINLTWFGGEPLLNFKVIYEIEEFLNTKDVKINSSVVTNGTFLNETLLTKIKKTNISSFQITLDGDKIFHDKSRVFADKRGTFDLSLENIDLLLDNGFAVFIRINITKKNWNIKDLLIILNNRYRWKNVIIYINEVKKFDLSEDIDDFYFSSIEEYSDTHHEIQKMFLKNKMGFPRPTRLNIGCPFSGENGYIVEPDLKLNFCTSSENLDYIQGYIDLDGIKIINSENTQRKLSYSPFKIKECLECNILPMCMGGCQLKYIKGFSPCIPEKFNIDNFIKILHEESTCLNTSYYSS